MASIARLETLFSAVAGQDWTRARATALAIAQEEETHQHLPAAQRLRAALAHVNGSAKLVSPNGLAVHTDDVLTRVTAVDGISAVVLPDRVREEFQGIVQEWKHREALLTSGVQRRSRILLHGPPGCGKSRSATALGFETGLPVHVVRLDAIVGSYLGETASRVHRLLRWASENPSVLILDEIDAIARRRGKMSDVAELDRVVVALLQELEHTNPAGLLVATTNRLDELDDALFRRFDLVMEIPRPSRATLTKYAKHEATRLGMRLTAQPGRQLGNVRSFADARRVLEDVRRRSIITERQAR